MLDSSGFLLVLLGEDWVSILEYLKYGRIERKILKIQAFAWLNGLGLNGWRPSRGDLIARGQYGFSYRFRHAPS